MTKVMIKTAGRGKTEYQRLLTDEEIGKCQSMADAIRACIKKHPQATNATIARFLSEHHTKKVPPQWVFNVRHQELKRK